MRGSNENDRALRDDANLSNAPGLLYGGMGNYKTKFS